MGEKRELTWVTLENGVLTGKREAEDKRVLQKHCILVGKFVSCKDMD